MNCSYCKRSNCKDFRSVECLDVALGAAERAYGIARDEIRRKDEEIARLLVGAGPLLEERASVIARRLSSDAREEMRVQKLRAERVEEQLSAVEEACELRSKNLTQQADKARNQSEQELRKLKQKLASLLRGVLETST